MLILDSIISWSGVIDELDVARRLVSWNKSGFPELGEIRGPDFKGLFGKVLSSTYFLKVSVACKVFGLFKTLFLFRF